jgi:hypothetical protein
VRVITDLLTHPDFSSQTSTPEFTITFMEKKDCCTALNEGILINAGAVAGMNFADRAY